MNKDKCLQEDPEQKQLWLDNVQVRFPLGCTVRVGASDLEHYIGLKIRKVWLTRPLEEQPRRDGFYEEELVRL